MDRMLVVVFDSERQAYEGMRVLKELHDEGSITLYGRAVIARDVGGKPTVKESADGGPLGTAVGLVTGVLIGLLGGPVGVAIGGATGGFAGAMFDLTRAGVGADFVDEVARRLEPGKAAVVAEIEEDWVLPVDTRMEAVGGTVFRRTRGEAEDALIDRDRKAIHADLAALRAEREHASGEAKARLQARIDEAKAKLQEIRDRAKSRVETIRDEAEAKIKSLKEQADRAHGERKQQIEKRKAEVEADYKERAAKLHRASELIKEALTP